MRFSLLHFIRANQSSLLVTLVSPDVGELKEEVMRNALVTFVKNREVALFSAFATETKIKAIKGINPHLVKKLAKCDESPEDWIEKYSTVWGLFEIEKYLEHISSEIGTRTYIDIGVSPVINYQLLEEVVRLTELDTSAPKIYIDACHPEIISALGILQKTRGSTKLCIGLSSNFLSAVANNGKVSLRHTPKNLSKLEIDPHVGLIEYYGEESVNKILAIAAKYARNSNASLELVASDTLRSSDNSWATRSCFTGRLSEPAFRVELNQFVSKKALLPSFDSKGFSIACETVIRMVDNAIELACENSRQNSVGCLKSNRPVRINAGLAFNAAALMGFEPYSAKFNQVTAHILRTCVVALYEASATLAIERGSFPAFDSNDFLRDVNVGLEGTQASQLPKLTQRMIRQLGMRNALSIEYSLDHECSPENYSKYFSHLAAISNCLEGAIKARVKINKLKFNSSLLKRLLIEASSCGVISLDFV